MATLRVLGFRRWEVSQILLGELALLTLLAIPLGCAIGFGLALFLVPSQARAEGRRALLDWPTAREKLPLPSPEACLAEWVGASQRP